MANAPLAVAQAAPAPDAGSNVTPYNPEFFSQFRPNTALDMIGRLPGFSFQDSGNGRGFSGTAGNVLIDGERPPSRGDYLSSILARIPASGVERIEVVRGGTDGIDMQGQAIVANIIRKPDAGLTGSISANLNVNDEGNASPNASMSFRNQSAGQLAEASLSLIKSDSSAESSGARVDPLGVVIRQSESKAASTFERIEATAAWETAWLGGKLRLNALASAEQVEVRQDDVLVVPGGLQLSRTASETASGEAGVRFSRTLAGGYSLEVVGFQSAWFGEIEGAFDTPAFTSGNRSDDETGERIARATLRSPTFGEWTFEGGGELVYNYSKSEGARSLDGAPFALDGDVNRVDELRADGFATAIWAPSARLNAEAGARYEWSRITADVGALHSQKELMYLKPRVNVSWTPMEGHQLGFGVERIVDQLEFSSFASSAAFEQEIFGVGNADAEPEKNWTSTLRYERQFGGQSSLVVKLTHEDIEDILGRTVIVVPASATDPERELEITRNTGRARRDTLEVRGSIELDAMGMPGGILSLGGFLYDSRVVDPVTGEPHRMSDEAPWSASLGLSQTLDNGNFRWGVFLEEFDDAQAWSPRQYTERNGRTFLRASATWKPAGDWTLTLGVNNLLAEDQRVHSVFYNARRSVGSPLYDAYSVNDARRQIYVTVRKNF